jgi:hypothetical protein
MDPILSQMNAVNNFTLCFLNKGKNKGKGKASCLSYDMDSQVVSFLQVSK